MYRIGIDLGGTNIAAGVVDESQHIVAEVSVPTGAERGAEAVVADICRAAELAMAKAGITAAHCASIGIGSPGTCDGSRGVVVRAYNLGWFNVPVCDMVTARLGLPCRLSNDANCAALAETVAGAAVGCRNMVLVTLGTGVGVGIVSDGKLLEGVGGTGAEAGHAILVLDGEPCTCGRKGCWEAYASATALIRQGRRAALAHPESLLARCGDALTAKDVFDAADGGDETAQAVLAQYYVYVAAGVTDLVNILGPENGAHRRRHQPSGRAAALSRAGVCGRQLLRRSRQASAGDRGRPAGQRSGHHRRGCAVIQKKNVPVG